MSDPVEIVRRKIKFIIQFDEEYLRWADTQVIIDKVAGSLKDMIDRSKFRLAATRRATAWSVSDPGQEP